MAVPVCEAAGVKPGDIGMVKAGGVGVIVLVFMVKRVLV